MFFLFYANHKIKSRWVGYRAKCEKQEKNYFRRLYKRIIS